MGNKSSFVSECLCIWKEAEAEAKWSHSAHAHS